LQSRQRVLKAWIAIYVIIKMAKAFSARAVQRSV
jgi:hypothetical protein